MLPRITSLLVTGLALLFLGQGPLLAADLTPLEIIKKSDKLDDGETMISSMTMILVDKKDNKRVRQIKAFRKDYGEDSKSISFFLSPADVKNTSFLTFDYDDDNKDDDNWLYLPALRKVKRIAAGNKKDSFMGSDFTYHDMNGLKIEQWQYQFVKESDMVDGKDCWVIGSLPRPDIKDEVVKDTGYTKRMVWIRKDNFMAIKGQVWLKKGNKFKIFQASEIEQIQGIWTAKKLEMRTYRKDELEHATVLVFQDIVYNKGVEDKLFTTQRMEQGL